MQRKRALPEVQVLNAIHIMVCLFTGLTCWAYWAHGQKVQHSKQLPMDGVLMLVVVRHSRFAFEALRALLLFPLEIFQSRTNRSFHKKRLQKAKPMSSRISFRRLDQTPEEESSAHRYSLMHMSDKLALPDWYYQSIPVTSTGARLATLQVNLWAVDTKRWTILLTQ